MNALQPQQTVARNGTNPECEVQRNPVSVAPMMRRTDRHFRYFMRQISTHTLLYTEMITASSIIHGNCERLLGFSDIEQPLVLQVGGNDPEKLAECARIAERFGYDGINLNIGCPSNKVQEGHFGVCLMAHPHKVAKGVEAMRRASDLPVSVKHRIGFDDRDSFEDMKSFVDTVASAGCTKFTVHARKAWLDGLSPSENRDVPPLRHSAVVRLKRTRPDLIIETNGHIDTVESTQKHLDQVDAVMIGRAAYDNPYLFAVFDRDFYGASTVIPTRDEIARSMLDYADWWLRQGGKLIHVTQRMLNLFAYKRGASQWRRHLSEEATRPDAGPEVIEEALQRVPESSRYDRPE